MIVSERRKMERFLLELPTCLSLAVESKKQESIELPTNNVCAGGAFFKTEKPLSVGTDLRIALIIPLNKLKDLAGKRSRIDVSGSVIRIDKKGMAVRFDERWKFYRIKR